MMQQVGATNRCNNKVSPISKYIGCNTGLVHNRSNLYPNKGLYTPVRNHSNVTRLQYHVSVTQPNNSLQLQECDNSEIYSLNKSCT